MHAKSNLVLRDKKIWHGSSVTRDREYEINEKFLPNHIFQFSMFSGKIKCLVQRDIAILENSIVATCELVSRWDLSPLQ